MSWALKVESFLWQVAEEVREIWGVRPTQCKADCSLLIWKNWRAACRHCEWPQANSQEAYEELSPILQRTEFYQQPGLAMDSSLVSSNET